MTAADVLAQLKKLDTAQNRKIYARHGVVPEVFGVGFADLKKLHKQIKTDQNLAERLWDSGNHDARILATMIADPAAMTARKLDRWAKELDNYVVADAFSALVARTDAARAKMEQWSGSDSDWLGQVGWNVLAHLAMRDAKRDEAYLQQRLAVIEKQIHGRKNRTRHAMNGALIAIGLCSARLQKAALETERGSAGSRSITAKPAARHPTPPPTSERRQNADAPRKPSTRRAKRATFARAIPRKPVWHVAGRALRSAGNYADGDKNQSLFRTSCRCAERCAPSAATHRPGRSAEQGAGNTLFCTVETQ